MNIDLTTWECQEDIQMDLTTWLECSDEAQNEQLQTAFKKQMISEVNVLYNNRYTISAESRELEKEANKEKEFLKYLADNQEEIQKREQQMKKDMLESNEQMYTKYAYEQYRNTIT